MLVSPFAGRISKHVGVGITLRGGLLQAIIGLASMGMISNLPLLIVMRILLWGDRTSRSFTCFACWASGRQDAGDSCICIYFYIVYRHKLWSDYLASIDESCKLFNYISSIGMYSVHWVDSSMSYSS